MVHFIKKLLPVFLSLLLLLNGNGAFAVIANGNGETGTIDSRQKISEKTNGVDGLLNYSTITDIYEGDDDSLIVVIQDLHNDYSVQNNIYKTIETLTKNKNFDIYGEGVFDEILNVSVLNDISDNRIKKYTIDNLFKNSQLSAYEYFALIKNKEIKGIEDKNIYLENLKTYNEITANKEFNKFLVDEVLAKVAYTKKYFIEDRISAIQNMELVEIPFEEKQYPNLYKYKIISQKISQINKNKLNRQFKNFVAKYKTYPKIYELLKLNSQYGYAKLYEYINKNMPDVAKSNKELMLFLEKTKTITEINSVKLLYEKQMLTDSLLSKENLEITEKEMLSLEEYCSYLKDLAGMNILPEDYRKLKENKKYARELIKKYLPKNEAAFALTILNNEKFYTFYDNNFKRNKIFADVLIRDNSDKIIIAGGFHKGLTDEIRKIHRSYIVLTPNISAMNAAFNKLFLNAFETGFTDDVANNVLTVIYSWRPFFRDTASFQRAVDSWIKNSKVLQDKNIEIFVFDDRVSVKYNNTIFEKAFVDTGITKTEIKPTIQQQNKTVKDILNIARRIELFGKNTAVKIVYDDSMLEAVLPVRVEQEDGQTNIYINRKFLDVLSQAPHLTEFFVRLLYYYNSPASNAEEMLKFIEENYDSFRQLHNLKNGIEPSVFSKVKKGVGERISKFFERIGIFVRRNIRYELPSTEITSVDENNMNHALKQVSLARQTRLFLTTFIQPPVGAYISLDTAVEEDEIRTIPYTVTITGKGFNDTGSVLHAETLTFIDFLRNYIDEFERLPTGENTEKGEFLKTLLKLAEINGKDVSNRIFETNPTIFLNYGLSAVDYSGQRNINTVFDETNAVLKFVNDQLGNPLSKVTLYCTLAPCNKCVNTMSVLGIERLVFGSYSANKSHKGSKVLQDKGIEVTGGILEGVCDNAIKNYRFMNASMFRTKIASALQTIRRFYLLLVKKLDVKKVEKLLDKVSSYGFKTGTNVFELQYTLETLQENLNWDNLQENEALLDDLVNFLKQINAYDSPAKRAGIIYALKNGCTFKAEDGKVFFYNIDGQKLLFFINSSGKFEAPQNYLDKMEQLALVRNFADLDDNLAIRGKPFNDNIRRVFSVLTLYGIGNPIPVTGNILDLAKKRLEPLGKSIMNLIPSVFIENAAIRCDIIDGNFVYDTDYMENVADSTVKEGVLEYLRNMFSDIGEQWYDLFIFFADKAKDFRNNEQPAYSELVEVVLADYKIPDILKDYIPVWGNLTRQESSEKLLEIYKKAMDEKLNTEEFLYVLKIASLMELSRLYFSKDADDSKEAVRLKQDFDKLYDGKDLRGNFESPVRFVISPFRPNLVREIFVKYFRPIVRAKYPNLKVESSGQTTFSIYKDGVDKCVPVRAEFDKGISADNIIFSGDEFNKGGVDYPLYEMQQLLAEYNPMVIVNTNYKTFDGSFISLRKKESLFSQDDSFYGNIERSLVLQNIILSIVEENIAKLATDPEYVPKESVAQQVKEIIDSVEAETSSNISDRLKDEQEQEKEFENIILLLSAA